MISQPYYSGFSPDVIPYQRAVCDLIRDFDYKSATPEILLSGSYGSAKSTLMAHLAIRHCAENSGARVCIARRSMPDLKRTIWREVLDHMAHDFIEGIDYKVNRSEHTVRFRNGSEIISASWADKLYKKFRSLKLSMLVIEEIVENNDDDEEAFKQLKARLRRVDNIQENILIAATNPDQPGHWVYKYFIASQPHDNRFVFYSRTEDNPFIDQAYIQQLRRDMSPKEALRYLDGQWIEIMGEVIYSEYDSEIQYRKTQKYEINPTHPVILSWDFNIALDKPISMVCMQYIGDVFYIFNEVVVDGARTAETIDELDNKGILRKDLKYFISGDASGKHRDTRQGRSDYDIIMAELNKRGLNYEFHVPMANPSVRNRHNKVNAYCLNANGERRLFVYGAAPTVDEGFRLTKLKAGANYIEDDSKRYQHCLTAVGYAVMFETMAHFRSKQETTFL